MAAKKKTVKKETREVKKESEKRVAPKKNLLALHIEYLKNVKKIYLIAALVILAAVFYYFKGNFFVASVNGKLISRTQMVGDMQSMYGQQTLENLITKELIFQKAQTEGVIVGVDEIQKEIDDISAQLSEQGTDLEQALSFQGQTLKTFKENIKMQKMVEKIFESKVEVTEEDILKYYDDNSSFFEEGSTFEDVRGEIENMLKQSKIAEEFATWIEQEKQDAQINYFVDL